MPYLQTTLRPRIDFLASVLVLTRYHWGVHIVAWPQFIYFISWFVELLGWLRAVSDPLLAWLVTSLYRVISSCKALLIHFALARFRHLLLRIVCFCTLSLRSLELLFTPTVAAIVIGWWTIRHRSMLLWWLSALLLRFALPNQVFHMLYFGLLVLVVEVRIGTAVISSHHELVAPAVDLGDHLVLHMTVILDGVGAVAASWASLPAGSDHLIPRSLASIRLVTVLTGDVLPIWLIIFARYYPVRIFCQVYSCVATSLHTIRSRAKAPAIWHEIACIGLPLVPTAIFVVYRLFSLILVHSIDKLINIRLWNIKMEKAWKMCNLLVERPVLYIMMLVVLLLYELLLSASTS